MQASYTNAVGPRVVADDIFQKAVWFCWIVRSKWSVSANVLMYELLIEEVRKYLVIYNHGM